MTKFTLSNEPQYRRDFFKNYPELFDLKQEFMNELIDKNGANPNEMGLRLLPKIQENHNRKLQGKNLVPFSDAEKAFMRNKISKKWYVELATKLVNDPRYTQSFGIPVVAMDQKGDEESWHRYRKGILPDYVKAIPMSPSSSGPLMYPESAKFGGQSIVAMKRDKQGLPFYGEKDSIDSYIAQRGHDGESYIYKQAANAIKHHLDIDVEMYDEPEVMYEHVVFGDFLQGNMDGVCQNLDNFELEGVEIKTTGVQNQKQIIDYQNGIIPDGYLVQCCSYMAIRGFNAVNLIAGWGLGYKDGMSVIRILRSKSDEANLLGTILWFAIEVVLKDLEIDDTIKYLNPSVLVNDLYSIYGKETTGKVIDTDEPEIVTATNEYVRISKEIDVLTKRHKSVIDGLKKELNLQEAILLEKAEDAERLNVKVSPTDLEVFFLKTKSKTRFTVELYDAALKNLNKGVISDEEFNELVRDKKALSKTTSTKALDHWKRVTTTNSI